MIDVALIDVGKLILTEPAEARHRLEQIIALLPAISVQKDDNREPNGSSHVLAPWQALKVQSFIDAHLSEPIQIQSLAAAARLSTSYFFRAFKGTFGTAPHHYVMQRRTDRAKQHLRSGEEPIAQVALNCGFSDQAHFSRVFARHTGLPPSAWRRLHQQDASAALAN
ncbi:helix-turn-helix domain-containing protein [Sphingopyxis sp. KK2]|uniref:helix-turn-helix domain-containing protein n=1 Tax=Sphingopyxis sp. KK2 TaxID=1855727 RepID=UPI001C4DF477|nr:AraC family transcriptional regulator [Sphingopyxis sp. KK2]